MDVTWGSFINNTMVMGSEHLLLIDFVQIYVWWWVGVRKLNTGYILYITTNKLISPEIM